MHEVGFTAGAKKKRVGGMTSVVLKNAWRTGNILLSRWLRRPPRYLPVIILFVTGNCNLRCRMCGVCDLEHGYTDGAELDTGQWKAVIHSAAHELGTTLAVFSGGEVLLRDDIFELIRFASDQGVAIHLCTNGLLLNESNMIRLRDSGVDTVSFSLESHEPSAHEFLRGPDSFPVVVNAIRQFHAIAPAVRIGINFVITKRNYRNMAEMVHFAEELGAHQIKFAPIHTNLLHRKKKVEDYSDILFQADDLADLEIELRRARKACRDSRLISASDAFWAGITQLYRNPRRIRCYAGYAVGTVSPTGSVAPCSEIDSVFTVKDRPLEEIWRDPDFHALRKRVDDCGAPCWDTAYTELSLWLRPHALLLNLFRNLRDVKFYFGK